MDRRPGLVAVDDLRAMDLTGPQKAAIFLLNMGEEFTTSFFKILDEKSIKKIGKYMSEISYIPSDVLKAVMDEFLNHFQDDMNVVVSGKDFLENVVSNSLEEEKAREIFKGIGHRNVNTPFIDLAYLPADNVVKMLVGEHPQTIALILSYLPQEKGAEILSLLPEETRSDVAFRVVKIENVQDELINELDEAIKKDIAKIGGATKQFDGVETLATILNEVDRKTEESVMSHIEKEDTELAEKIRQKMFVFEDLLETEDKSFRDILQNVDNQSLSKALKTASEEMKQKIFKNLSERAAEMLKEDMEVMGPVRLREVEEAQQEIIRTAKRLESEGRIVLGGKGKEDILV
jgi:flagellar motor switch protein FliG